MYSPVINSKPKGLRKGNGLILKSQIRFACPQCRKLHMLDRDAPTGGNLMGVTGTRSASLPQRARLWVIGGKEAGKEEFCKQSRFSDFSVQWATELAF